MGILKSAAQFRELLPPSIVLIGFLTLEDAIQWPTFLFTWREMDSVSSKWYYYAYILLGKCIHCQLSENHYSKVPWNWKWDIFHFGKQVLPLPNLSLQQLYFVLRRRSALQAIEMCLDGWEMLAYTPERQRNKAYFSVVLCNQACCRKSESKKSSLFLLFSNDINQMIPTALL